MVLNPHGEIYAGQRWGSNKRRVRNSPEIFAGKIWSSQRISDLRNVQKKGLGVFGQTGEGPASSRDSKKWYPASPSDACVDLSKLREHEVHQRFKNRNNSGGQKRAITRNEK